MAVINGDDSNNTLDGTSGDDVIHGYGGSDVIHGFGGNDALYGETEDDFIYGGDGNDTIDGGAGSDHLYGEAGDDLIYGGDNPDEITGGAGNDTMDGGLGSNVARFSGSIASYTMDHSGAALMISGPDGVDTLYNFDRLQFDDVVIAAPGAGGQTITGTSSAELLAGGATDDWIHAGGDDTLDGGAGNNFLDGGTGVNTVTYASAPGPVTVDLYAADTATASDRHDILFHISAAIGSSYNDTLTAGAGGLLMGGPGDDQLNGHGGGDTLDGGAGNDSISGDSQGFDWASYADAPSAVSVSTNTGDFEGTGGAGSDELDYIDGVIGSAYNDHLIANDLMGVSYSILHGGDGGDTLEASYGADQLFGDNGDDVLLPRGNGQTVDGGAGFDYVSFAHFFLTGVTVDLNLSGFQGVSSGVSISIANVEGVYGSPNDDHITGDGGDNRLFGSAGNDIIDGGAGSDAIDGGAGTDVLTGGSGTDLFIFAAASDSTMAAPDRIEDFSSGDRIDLSAIDADTTTAGRQSFHVGGGGGHAGDILVLYEPAYGQTTLYLYTDNDSTPDMRITLTGDHSGLTSADFVF